MCVNRQRLMSANFNALQCSFAQTANNQTQNHTGGKLAEPGWPKKQRVSVVCDSPSCHVTSRVTPWHLPDLQHPTIMQINVRLSDTQQYCETDRVFLAGLKTRQAGEGSDWFREAGLGVSAPPWAASTWWTRRRRRWSTRSRSRRARSPRWAWECRSRRGLPTATQPR